MINSVKRSAALVACFALVATLSACVSFGQDPIDCEKVNKTGKVPAANQVSVVLAPTSNFTKFEELLESVRPNIRELLGDQPGEINVIVADGEPKNVLRLSSDATGEDGSVKNKHITERVSNALYCVQPTTGHPVQSPIPLVAESNMIKALGLAAVPFANNAESRKKIFVIGNGIHTAGDYSFLEKGIPSEGTVAPAVAKLLKARALPDLYGATVTWTGLGQVSGAQPALNEQSLKGLKAFWLSVIEASNGTAGAIAGEGQTGTPADGSIKVSPVKVLPKACVSTTLSEKDGFNFVPNTATFRDLAAAKAGAAGIAQELAKNPSCQGAVTVTGYVASAVAKSQYVFGNQADQSLSSNRAEAFKALLVAAGVKVPIVTVGGGKGPEIDWDANGAYDESKGQLNRKVTVIQQ